MQSAKGGYMMFIVPPNLQPKWLTRLLAQAANDCVLREVTGTWPGTVSCSRPVTAFLIPMTESVIELSIEIGSLFNWISPDYPEDPAFLTQDQQLWFYSTTHESEWGIDITRAPSGTASLLDKLHIHWF